MLNLSENTWLRKDQPTQYKFSFLKRTKKNTNRKKRRRKEKWRELLTIRPARPPLALDSGMAMEENGRCCQTHIIQ